MQREGKVLDNKYRLLRLIGEGGMGAVYEAEHTFLGKKVAIKLLASHYAGHPDAVKRLYREAQAAARIGHENICDIIDVGEGSGRSPYIVMQLLHGRPLSEAIKDAAPFPIGRAVDITVQALEALAAAHAAGIVHRDLKPDNVFLTRVGGREDFVKLLDFGVSKIRSVGADGATNLTRTGALLGTPVYMSPEQARGQTDVDHRADLWAMGIVAFEMLTGKVPFDGQNFQQVMFQVVEAPIPKPSALRPGLPREIEAAVMGALDRDRERRYQSAEAFRDALVGAWVGGVGATPVTSRPTPAPTPAPAPAPAPAAPLPVRAPGSGGTIEARITQRSTSLRARARGRRTLVLAAAIGVAMVVAGVAIMLGRSGAGGAASRASSEAGGSVVARAPSGPAPPQPAVETSPAASLHDGGPVQPGAVDSAGVTADAGPGAPTVALAPVDAAPAVGPAITRPSSPVAGVDAGAQPVMSPPDAGVRRPPGGDAAAVRRAVGRLTVVTEPRTDVFLDGRALGRTPLLDFEVPAGRYTLRLVDAALGIRHEEPVTVAAGRTTTVRRFAAQLGVPSARDGGTASRDAGPAAPAAPDAGAQPTDGRVNLHRTYGRDGR